MFGASGELIKRGLAAERLYLTVLLTVLPGSLIDIILDYATIDPHIVDAMSIKANRVEISHTSCENRIYYKYSIMRHDGPELETVLYKNGILYSTDRVYTNVALLRVIALYDVQGMVRVYSALLHGYKNLSQSEPVVKYNSESD